MRNHFQMLCSCDGGRGRVGAPGGGRCAGRPPPEPADPGGASASPHTVCDRAVRPVVAGSRLEPSNGVQLRSQSDMMRLDSLVMAVQLNIRKLLEVREWGQENESNRYLDKMEDAT